MKTTKATHTLGPWRAEQTGAHDMAGWMVTVGQAVVASVSNRRERARANATLIAAAPTLLDLLEQSHTTIAIMAQSKVAFDQDELQSIADRVLAGIKLAKGEPKP